MVISDERLNVVAGFVAMEAKDEVLQVETRTAIGQTGAHERITWPISRLSASVKEAMTASR